MSRIGTGAGAFFKLLNDSTNRWHVPSSEVPGLVEAGPHWRYFKR